MARALAILLALSLLVYTTSAALPRFSSYDFQYKGTNKTAVAEIVKRLQAAPSAGFDKYIATFAIKFADTAEKNLRLAYFKASLETIRKQNALTKPAWVAAPNQFMHLSWSEFQNMYLAPGLKLGPSSTAPGWTTPEVEPEHDTVPTVQVRGSGRRLSRGAERKLILDPKVPLDQLDLDAKISPKIDLADIIKISPKIDPNDLIKISPNPIFVSPIIPILKASSFDWRNKTGVSYVRGVRNQLSCGSCWAMAAAASVESLYKIQKNRNVDLSVEQLVDCCDTFHGYSSWACSGGYSDQAFMYLRKNALVYMNDYPYAHPDSDVCEETTTIPAAKALGHYVASGHYVENGVNYYGAVSGWVNVGTRNHTKLKEAIKINPVVFYFRVVDSFRFYSGGVYEGDCLGDLNHAMTLVGWYDSYLTLGSRYWIVKNSWGSGWGESGYIRVKMITTIPDNGMCGMYTNLYRPYL